MTRRSGLVLAALVVLATLAVGVVPAPAAAQDEDCSFPVTVTDGSGTEVTLDEEPEEIVVTAPSAAQTIWELDEQDRVVGLDADNSAYLEGAEEKTDVLNDDATIDEEQVVDLDPDLVIAPSITSEEEVESLRDAGLTVYHEPATGSIDEIQSNTQTFGQLLGACEAADETVDWMDERLEIVEDATDDVDRPSMYYWLFEGYTAPEGSFQHALMETAGVDNAAAEMDVDEVSWQLADEEQIVEEDPEYLLLQGGDEVPDNEAIQATTAVQEDNIVHVDRNNWNQNAPRVVLAVEEIVEQVHPDAYEEALDEAEAEPPTDPADENETNEDGNESSEDESDDGSPGFGVPAAIAALIAGAAAIGRRV